ncbi:MAG: hypothetical protein AVDCRST_MAG87-1882, partial [uncultured Thermomicrobiales bacterium]
DRDRADARLPDDREPSAPVPEPGGRRGHPRPDPGGPDRVRSQPPGRLPRPVDGRRGRGHDRGAAVPARRDPGRRDRRGVARSRVGGYWPGLPREPGAGLDHRRPAKPRNRADRVLDAGDDRVPDDLPADRQLCDRGTDPALVHARCGPADRAASAVPGDRLRAGLDLRRRPRHWRRACRARGAGTLGRAAGARRPPALEPGIPADRDPGRM